MTICFRRPSQWKMFVINIGVRLIIASVTYIHNWPLQPFSQDYGLASHTTHVVCVNFMREWRDLQFNVDSNDRFLRNFFMVILFTLRVSARNLLRGSRRRNIFSYLMWGLNPCPISHKPTHFLPDYDDVITKLHLHT